MNSKNLVLPLFILVALAQLYVPAKMIWNNEDVLKTGKEFKFKTAPIDPNDPFRGKYIVLNFNNTRVPIPKDHDWTRGEDIYVSIKEDEEGFVSIHSIAKEKPEGKTDFVKAKVGFITSHNNSQLNVDYPFDRFYMEEFKAPEAEITYRESRRDTTKTAYALVSVKQGDAVLKDVLIDGVSIKELVNTVQEEPK
ncbi:GDYXXLXY domain-containing protein [Flagellimonas sp. S174]|uniref:GDYXXLXY domain-containing protein n=1 Tax=Flagellimonas sp. S174 TaxID=3410790 RepID=UPI003BF576AA